MSNTFKEIENISVICIPILQALIPVTISPHQQVSMANIYKKAADLLAVIVQRFRETLQRNASRQQSHQISRRLLTRCRIACCYTNSLAMKSLLSSLSYHLGQLVNGHSTDAHAVNVGVIQGSLLGPTEEREPWIAPTIIMICLRTFTDFQ